MKIDDLVYYNGRQYQLGQLPVGVDTADVIPLGRVVRFAASTSSPMCGNTSRRLSPLRFPSQQKASKRK